MKFGRKAKIVKMSYDGKHLLKNTDVFIGSGGTMTAESALLGIQQFLIMQYQILLKII